ncbi:Os01g0319066 [Oryza sativa Japonica Group]|uniref:Os01g0319066 protein n=1 Tax=Oryza sativa subsp. japonica TaxID=39947 RepID=A0A0N7KCV0_ORYSJ|nr:hypothetical protein EE612_002171 [Oryza sativa]BAS71833.1 Os01g0319066 [Oryza sativa Japonica Group]
MAFTSARPKYQSPTDFAIPLVLESRRATIPGGRQLGLAVSEARVDEQPVAPRLGEDSHRCHHLISETLQELQLRRVAGCAVELADSPGAAGVSCVRGQALLDLPDVVRRIQQEDGCLYAVDYCAVYAPRWRRDGRCRSREGWAPPPAGRRRRRSMTSGSCRRRLRTRRGRGRRRRGT